jgi:Fe-Mn family superoxide dismutase
MVYELKKLPYAYDALEPYIDKETMELHHSKHHKTYVDKYNAAIEGNRELQKLEPEAVVADLNNVPEKIRNAVRNHGGGIVNHNLFWQLLKKDTKPKGDLLKALEEKFGSLDDFKKDFSAAALGVFGSGWAWLVFKDGELEIVTTPNQDSPTTQGFTPLLTIDVWEHAYYVKYRNRRADYVDAFWNVVNWDKVSELYVSAKKKK